MGRLDELAIFMRGAPVRRAAGTEAAEALMSLGRALQYSDADAPFRAASDIGGPTP
jgi:hypothetical protein